MTNQANKDTNKARWYAFYDPIAKGWKPLFCNPSFAKWTDLEISDEVGDKFYQLGMIECEEATQSAIEKIVVETYANLRG